MQESSESGRRNPAERCVIDSRAGSNLASDLEAILMAPAKRGSVAGACEVQEVRSLAGIGYRGMGGERLPIEQGVNRWQRIKRNRWVQGGKGKQLKEKRNPAMSTLPNQPAAMKPLLLSIKETAFLLGVSERTVWSMVQERQLPHVRVGRRLLFSRAGLEAWIAAQQANAG